MSEFIKLTGVDPVRGISHRMSVLRSQIYMVSDVDMVAPCKGATVFTFQDDDTAIRTVESYEEIMALLEETPVPCLPQPPEPCPDVRFAAGQFLWAMMCVRNRFNVRRPGWKEGRVLNTGNFHHAASMDEGDIFADDWKLSHAHLLSSERQPRTAEVLQERGENQ